MALRKALILRSPRSGRLEGRTEVCPRRFIELYKGPACAGEVRGLPPPLPCYKAHGASWSARLPTVFILNGPNLNLLGVREPATYGYDTLADVEQRCLVRAAALDLQVEFRQSNHEGQLVDWIQEARDAADGIILNAGALTHTSVAILDALNAAELPVIEVHLSNIFRRESFRHHSYVSLAARGVICGLGPQGYELALEALASLIEAESGEASP